MQARTATAPSNPSLPGIFTDRHGSTNSRKFPSRGTVRLIEVKSFHYLREDDEMLCLRKHGLIRGIILCFGLLFLFLGSTSSTYGAELLFKSSFAGLQLGNPYGCATSCWQDIEGSDPATGYTWAPQIWQGGGRFQLLADTPVTRETVGTYVFNEI